MEMTNNAPIAGASPVSAFISMLYEPTRTFRQLEAKPRGWFPMLVLMISTSALMYWYFSVVDFAWLLEQMLASAPSAEEREAARQFMSKGFMQTSAIGGALLAVPFMFAIMGLYLMLVSKSMAQGLSFGRGFALAAWSSVPAILTVPLGAMQILMAPSGQLTFSALNPLSLNQLFFHYDMAHPLTGFLDGFSLFTVWSTVLMIIGFEVWAKVQRATALKVVLIPTVLVYGAWLAYGLSQLP